METEPVSILLILGAGGHGRVVADAALRQAQWETVHATDRDPVRCSGDLLPGVPLTGLQAALASGHAVHVAIGNAQAREAESQAAGVHRLATVIHPDATVSSLSRIGAGCFVAAQAVVAPGAVLGLCVILNHGAVADHDVEVGDFTHIAPRAALGGGVRVGRRVLLGTGASVLPGRFICDDVIVGAGAVVHEHLTEPGVYAGVPARRIK